MVPEMEKPRVTEIRVRMDCNGCVQKIKKALHGITGIYDLYIDFPQQKITIIGWADPAKIVKAIKKTKKSAIICSHTEQPDPPAQQTVGEPPEGGAPPSESTNQPTETPPTNLAPPEAPQESSPPPDHPPPEEKRSPSPSDERERSQSNIEFKPKEHEEIHVVHHHPPNYGYRYAYDPYQGQRNMQVPSGTSYGSVPDPYHQQGNEGQSNPYPGFRGAPPQPVYVTHSYNASRPAPYVTEYAYPQFPPEYLNYSRPVQYSDYNQVYYSGSSSNNNGNGNGNGNITSMFCEENPNSCSIM